MPKSLVIVESPAKAKTINRYLGPGYLVKASMGHVRDLPRRKLGVDIESDFKPNYEIIPERKKVVTELKKAAIDCESIILAADPDREGEAISWHLSTFFEGMNKTISRALLHEITKRAIQDAFGNLGQLDQNKINAQQTRRILDRLVGYLISPLLWKKIGRGLSAGRVQSIALRLICEREQEIKDFVPEEYWSLIAHLQASNPPAFKANLVKIDGKKAKIPDEKTAEETVTDLKQIPFVLEKIKIQDKKKNPGPPYITSTLQQDSYRLLSFPVKKTMSLAQKLYEGLEIRERGLVGLITYMRTDSVRISDEALRGARQYVEKNYSPAYLPAKPHVFKNKRKAQDAHEAIRPTLFDLPPSAVQPYLKKDEYSLYSLIWNRFMASQMSAAVVEETEFDIRASRYQFKAQGEVLKFDGFLILFSKQKQDEEILPKAREGETLTLLDLESKQNFTQPPPRYTEGTLVRELEAKGIGRPSTYAPIIATLQDRVYVIKEKGKFIPTDLGMFVTDFLVKNFPDLMEVKFTALMEEELDRISEGEQDWSDSLRRYYARLDRDLKQGMETKGVKATGIPVEEVCPECGRQLVIKEGRYGRFKACSGYPGCKYRQSLFKKETRTLEEKCPQCGSPLVLRAGKYGNFVACSNYPQCKYTKKEKTETGISCPLKCGGKILRRKTKRGRQFFGCSNFPKCKFATWDEPLLQPCPVCGREFVLRKGMLKENPYLYCWDEKCNYKEVIKRERIEEKKPEPSDNLENSQS
jgi:DNA topoisomerase-1